jgi:aminopeptidase YwaD
MDLLSLDKKILSEAWTSTELWNHMLSLCDSFNSRFATTVEERKAGDYILECFHRYGLQNVHAESFKMPAWERGTARLVLITTEGEVEIPCLALPGTHACDLVAEIIDVGNGGPEDYQKLTQPAAGKIVLTNPAGINRMDKYAAAVEAGAAAFFFSSDKPGMLIPTGSTGNPSKTTPAAGLACEHAARIRRLLAKGPLTARLVLTSHAQPGIARNIVGEIPGADPSQGWIVACGHYDGHDIAQGAIDNATGTAVIMEAARLLSPLREHLQAGIRFILFSGEELGLYGSYAYAAAHADEMDSLRVIFNADIVGLAMPLVLLSQASPETVAWLRTQPLKELDVIVEDSPRAFIMNSDHFPFSEKGIQGFYVATSHPAGGGGWGHTAADTLDKLEVRELRQAAAASSRLLLRMAACADTIPKVRRTPEEVKQLLLDAGFEKSLRFKGHWPF